MFRVVRPVCFLRAHCFRSWSDGLINFSLWCISFLALAFLVATVCVVRLVMDGAGARALQAQPLSHVVTIGREALRVPFGTASGRALMYLHVGEGGVFETARHSLAVSAFQRRHELLDPGAHIRTGGSIPVCRCADGTLTTVGCGRVPRGDVLLNGPSAQFDVCGRVLQVSTSATPL
jgi:hypothetical protein